MRPARTLRLALIAAAAACSQDPSSLPVQPDALLAKGGPGTTTQPVDFTIVDGGFSLASDGKDTYRDGTCGVLASWSSNTISLSPAGGKIPKSQQASCTGIAPRAASLTLALRHISDSPHVDDAASPPGSGAFNVLNVKFGTGTAQATTINSSAACGTAGLRFTPVTYPGTDHVVREDLGGGLWRMYTRPWPDNKAYCEFNGTPTYWHVSLDLYVQVR